MLSVFWLLVVMRSCRSGKAQGTLTSCRSSGKSGGSSKKKGSEVLTQMALNELLGTLATGQTTQSSARSVQETLQLHTSSSPPFSQTLKLSSSFKDYNAYLIEREGIENLQAQE